MPERSIVVKPPIPLRSTASFGPGVTAHVVRTESVTSAGAGPGQISGAPSVAFTLSFDNGSPTPVALNLVNVVASYGSQSTPALPVDGPPGQPFAAVAAARASASAVYVFAIPADQRDQVTLELSYSVDAPTVVFTGSVR